MAANPEWHYSKNDTQFGPVSAAELKQLAVSGELTPNDLIWKDGMGEWKRADTIKGLFPEDVIGTKPPKPPQHSRPESIRAAAEAAEKVSQKLWFLDLKFEQFATPRLIGFVFTLALVGLIMLAIGIVVYALLNEPVIKAVFIVIVDVILLAFLAVCLRVFLECCLVGFRIAEHLSYLRHLEKMNCHSNVENVEPPVF